jgi:site-specific recombinase XerC
MPKKPPPPKEPRDELVVVGRGGALARPPTLEDNPLALYMASLRSPASRRTMLSALGRAARIFDALDHGLTAGGSSETAVTYPWAAEGALTFARVQAAVAIVAEELNRDGEPKATMAALVLAALRGMARTLFGIRRLSLDERMRIDDVKPPKLSGRTRGRRLTDAEIARLFEACRRDTTPFGRRDAAILAVMLGTGLRRFEVSALDLRDYRKPARLGRDPIVLAVRAGKGKKHADVVGSADVAVALEDWLVERGHAAGALFWASSGRYRPLEASSRLSEAGVYFVCLARGQEAHVELAPHDLRRTFITSFLERTHDLALAQKAARHSDPKTTSKYDMRKQAELMAAFGSATSGFRSEE